MNISTASDLMEVYPELVAKIQKNERDRIIQLILNKMNGSISIGKGIQLISLLQSNKNMTVSQLSDKIMDLLK